MAALEKGITPNGEGYRGKTWNILGQVYYPKAVTDSTFAFETNSDPGQFVPVHIHPTQDEFILVQEGTLDLKLDGVWVKAHAGGGRFSRLRVDIVLVTVGRRGAPQVEHIVAGG